jgi:hypothetical protein
MQGLRDGRFSGQRIRKHVPAETDMNGTIEEIFYVVRAEMLSARDKVSPSSIL